VRADAVRDVGGRNDRYTKVPDFPTSLGGQFSHHHPGWKFPVHVRVGCLVVKVFVDEAMYQPGDGVYVLAAVLLDDSRKASARRGIRRVSPIRGHRFHGQAVGEQRNEKSR